MKFKIYHLLGILLIGVFMFSLRIDAAVAIDDDNDSVDDVYEYNNKRTISVVSIEEEKIEFESELYSGTTKDEFEIEISNDTGNELRVKFEYAKTSGSIEKELEISVKFIEILEYYDLNDDGFYNDSDDDITGLALYTINSFQRSIYTVEDIDSGNKLHRVIVNTTDGVFTAYFYIVEEFAVVNNTLITPAEVKMDIEINNFPYADQLNSQLALYVKFEVEVEIEEENETEDEKKGYAKNEDGLAVHMNGTTGFISWNKSAEIDDSILKNVNVSKDLLNQEIYITYANGTHIFHDPKIGVAGILQSPTVISGGDDDDDDEKEKAAIPGYEILVILGISIITTLAILYKITKNNKFK